MAQNLNSERQGSHLLPINVVCNGDFKELEEINMNFDVMEISLLFRSMETLMIFPMTDDPSSSATAFLAAAEVENVILPVPRCVFELTS